MEYIQIVSRGATCVKACHLVRILVGLGRRPCNDSELCLSLPSISAVDADGCNLKE